MPSSGQHRGPYGRDLQRLLNWLGSGPPVSRLKLSDLSEFVASLQADHLAPASISRAIVTTRMFFKYLQLEGVVQDNPAELLGSQKNVGTHPQSNHAGSHQSLPGCPRTLRYLLATRPMPAGTVVRHRLPCSRSLRPATSQRSFAGRLLYGRREGLQTKNGPHGCGPSA